MSNIKINYFPQDDAELFIYQFRCSTVLIDGVKQKNIFKNVHVCNANYDTPKKKKLLVTTICNLNNNSGEIKKILGTYNNIFKETITRLFIPGFWKYAEYLAYHIYQINNDLKISLVEEGLVSYNQDKYQLCYRYNETKPLLKYLSMLVSTIRSIVEVKKIRHILVSKLYNTIDSCYLYKNEIYKHSNTINTIKIPTINNTNQIYDIFKQNSLITSISKYDERKIINISQGTNPNYFSENAIITSINIIINSKGANQILIKDHPEPQNRLSIDVIKNLIDYESIYFDVERYPFEYLLANVDFNDKIIITATSSAAFTPKFMFDMEPHIIFTYKLHPLYSIQGEFLDHMTESLRECYINKGRIFVPESMEDFEIIIKKLNKIQ